MKNVIRLPDAINCSPQNNFSLIPNEIIRSPELSGNAKTIICILLSNSEGWTTFLATIEGMCKCGRSALNSAIQELEEFRLLWRVQFCDKKTKQKTGSFWAYTTVPGKFEIQKQLKYLEENEQEVWVWKDDEIYKQNLIENQYMGFQDMDNQPLRILTKKNTKEKEKNPLAKDELVFIEKFPREFSRNREFRSIWKLWVAHRKEIGSPLHNLKTSCTSMINDELVPLGVEQAIKTIKHTISKGWKGLRNPDENNKKQTSPSNKVQPDDDYQPFDSISRPSNKETDFSKLPPHAIWTEPEPGTEEFEGM